jgi:hypothetical protein
MRLCARLSRGEFALLARLRATSRVFDSLYLFESGLLGLHGCRLCCNPPKKNGQFCTGVSDTWRKIAITLLDPDGDRPILAK